MFQVDTDAKFTWLQIVLKGLRLTASWLHFLGWRAFTLLSDIVTANRVRPAAGRRKASLKRTGAAGRQPLP